MLFGVFIVRLSQNLCECRISKTNKGNVANFGHRCIWFQDVLIRFLGQRSRSQLAMTQKLCEYYISKTSEWNFAQFWSQRYLVHRCAD